MTVATTFPPVDPGDEKRLAQAATRAERARQERDALIVLTYLNGAGLREIARATKLSHPGVKAILERHAEDPSIIEEFKRREEKRELNRRLNRQRTADRK